jgi:dolichol-phosphate mannosyltransferase
VKSTNRLAVSLVVPTLNEAESLPELLWRVDLALAGHTYEVIVVDDYSSDGTAAVVSNLAADYPVKLQTKVGERGKASSLLQGFSAASYNLVAMIDADLQYPPEAIPAMLELLTSSPADLVVTERREQEISKLRQTLSGAFNYVFTKLLFGINYDTQSGLKLFKKRILSDMELTPSPWSFDLEFIVKTLENGHRILSYPIKFTERTAGETKVRVINTSFELAKASLKLWWQTSVTRVKREHRRSLRLQKATVGALAVLLVLASVTLVPAQVSAQSRGLLGGVTNTLNNTVHNLGNDVSNLLGGGNSANSSNANKQPPEPKSSGNSANSKPAPKPSGGNNHHSTPPANHVTQPSKPANLAPSNPPAQPVNQARPAKPNQVSSQSANLSNLSNSSNSLNSTSSNDGSNISKSTKTGGSPKSASQSSLSSFTTPGFSNRSASAFNYHGANKSSSHAGLIAGIFALVAGVILLTTTMIKKRQPAFLTKLTRRK